MTCGNMVAYTAFSIYATNSRTWVGTFLIDTWLVTGTVGINDTFRSTTTIRITKVALDTCTWTSTISFFAFSIRTTGGRITRCQTLFRNRWDIKLYLELTYRDVICFILTCWIATRKRIAWVTFITSTYWRMIDYITECIETTRSWTRIFTFLIHTS